jgi:uncharacterized Zn-finger protein
VRQPYRQRVTVVNTQDTTTTCRNERSLTPLKETRDQFPKHDKFEIALEKDCIINTNMGNHSHFDNEQSISLNHLKEHLQEDSEELCMDMGKFRLNPYTVPSIAPSVCQLRPKRKYVRNLKIESVKEKGIKKKAKKFTCKICHKDFNERGNLQVHLRIHTGERPYGCEFCLKRFTTIGNRNDHEKRHVKFKPFACLECPTKYYRKY